MEIYSVKICDISEERLNELCLPIGVDVEEVKPIECEEIAKNFFTAKEFDYIVNQDLKFQLDRFYGIWTLKESYIK